jgi:hypothetical protein
MSKGFDQDVCDKLIGNFFLFLTTYMEPYVFLRLLLLELDSNLLKSEIGIMAFRVGKHVRFLPCIAMASLQSVMATHLTLHTFQVITAGASAGVSLLINILISSPKAGIIIPIPQHPLYTAILAQYNGIPIPYYLEESTGWSTTITGIEKKSHNEGDYPKR